MFNSKSFEDKYGTDTANMQKLNKAIKNVCGSDMEAKILEDYTKAVAKSASPRKSPIKRAPRTLPSRNSPQKRKVTSDAEEDTDILDSPTKRLRVTQTLRSAPTFDSIRTTRSMSSSPMKPLPAPSTPRKAQRLAASPSKSPTKPPAATPTRRVKLDHTEIHDTPPSSDEEEDEPHPRRRFRPVFRDQKQWAMCDPRLVKLAGVVAEFNKRMVGRHGLPFADSRRDHDVAMDSD
jgi:hypothetical protein